MGTKQLEIVLVHGGFSDGSIWRRVIPTLRAAGFATSAAQLPLTSFGDDERALVHHLNARSTDVLLVGHSYGGLVVAGVAARHDQVRAAAYVSSPVPPAGVPFGAFLQTHPSPRPVALAPDASGFLWANEELLNEALGPDLSVEDRELFRAVQKPTSVNIYGGTWASDVGASRPAYYLVARRDLIVSVDTQVEIAARMNAEVTEVDSGHLSPLSAPADVAVFILAAARGVR